MTPVAYITPNFTANSVRFIEAFTALHNVRLVIISQETTTLLPSWQQSRIALSSQIPDVFNSTALITALEKIEKQIGSFHRLLGATEQLQIPLAEARQALGVEGMDIETANNFRDKSRMKLVFEHAGIPCAKHAFVTKYEDGLSFSKQCPYPYVVKPVSGAGSQTTYRVNNDHEMKSAFDQIGYETKSGVIIEEFIQGDEYSLDTFSLNGKTLGQTINQYSPTPLEAMSNPWIQWRVILRKETMDEAFDDVRKAGTNALNALGMQTGMSHMEWFRRKNGSLAISEVAARPPGAQFTTLISRACDFDVVRAWVNLMVYGKADISEVKYTSGAAYLRGQGSGWVTHVEGLEEIRSKYKAIITDIRVPKPGQEKSASYEGEGFVILRHRDSDVVENALEEIVRTVRVVLGT